MNALGEGFEALKQVLTSGSQWRYPGSDSLLKIALVRRSSFWTMPATAAPEALQNLGQITNLGYLSFPAEPGVRATQLTAVSDGEDGPSPLFGIDLGKEQKEETAGSMADTDTSQHTPTESLKRPRDRIRLPKLKKNAAASRCTTGMQVEPTPLFSDVCCAVCHWRFPLAYTEAQVARHQELASVGKCAKDISAYRTSQRLIRRSQAKPKNPPLDLRACYGGVRCCPHCSLAMGSGFSPEVKKAHIAECKRPCEQAVELEGNSKEDTDAVGEENGLGSEEHMEEVTDNREKSPSLPDTTTAPAAFDPFALRFSSLLKKSRLCTPSN